jgi:hypothetical protein
LESYEDRLLPSTFTVINLGDAGRGSGLQGDLRYAINSANSNTDLSNHIVFQTGLTGTVTLAQGTLVVSKALELSGPGADLLTVSGNRRSGVFDIEAPAGQSVILSDLTIADGTGSGNWTGLVAGGGLFNDNATVTLNRATLTRNTVPAHGRGGALFNHRGTMELNGTSVSNNPETTVDLGVSIENFGTLTLNQCTSSGNTGPDSGAQNIRNEGTMAINQSVISDNVGDVANGGVMTITDSILTRNTGTSLGGAVINAGQALIVNTIITNNVAGEGGGIANFGGTLTVRGSTIAGNTAEYGGGISTLQYTLTVTDSTISSNTAMRQGGGILDGGWSGYHGLAEIIGSTITGNVTTDGSFPAWGGGGIYNDLRLVLRDTIVAGNQSAGRGPDVNGTAISLGYNLIGATDFSSGWTDTDVTGTSASPIDPMLGPLQDNGGPTPTHALLLGSPAIGAGDVSLAFTPDQRGSPRRVDIGAFSTEAVFGFRVLAPASVASGRPFDVTLIAVDQWGNTASTYTGTVHFSTADLFAQLPDNTAFSGDDAGAHTFQVTLQTPGTQVIGVVDTNSRFVTGGATVDVAGTSEAVGSLARFGDLDSWETDAPGCHRRRV